MTTDENSTNEQATENQVARLKKLERKHATMKADLMQQQAALQTENQELRQALERAQQLVQQWSSDTSISANTTFIELSKIIDSALHLNDASPARD